MNSCKDQFRTALIIGCFFYYKKALRKYMQDLKMKKEYIKADMEPLVLDILTIILKDEITSKGIPYVKSILKSKCKFSKDDKSKWNQFWIYFKSFWLSLPKFISIWDIHNEMGIESSVKKYYDIHNCTNNSLER